MKINNYLEFPISDRYRILQESGDVDYIYILLQKHLRQSIDDLKMKYLIGYSITTDVISIEGNEEDIYYLFAYLSKFGLQFLQIAPKILKIQGNHLLTIIY